MTVSNVRVYNDLPFEDYLNFYGYSFSGIKNAGRVFEPTAKMQLGTDVHNYLLTPDVYNHKNRELVRPIVVALKEKLPATLLKVLKPELAVTATFSHENFHMPYKGRIDLCKPGNIIIDLKVSEVEATPQWLDFFGYGWQLSGYALAMDCKLAFIVKINPKTKKVTIINIPIRTEWWEDQIKRKGIAV